MSILCRDRTAPDKKIWVKERDVLEQVEDVINSIHVPEEFLPDIIKHIQGIHESEKGFHHGAIDDLNAEIKEIDSQMDKLTDLLIGDNINKDAYDRKFSQLQGRRQETSMLQEEHHNGNEQFKMALSMLVTIASKAPDIFKSSKTTLKRQLMTLIFSNLELGGQKLRYSLAEPFASFENLGSYKEWLGWQDSNLRMPIPKTGALPLGYTPTNEVSRKLTKSLNKCNPQIQTNSIFCCLRPETKPIWRTF